MNLAESQMDNKVRAGIIPFALDENGKVVMMFMRPSDPKYGGPKWQIAKGEIDPGENPQQAAVREGSEELGLVRSNIKNLTKVYGDKKWHIFACSVKDMKRFGKPHFETKDTAWLNWREIYSQGRRWQIKYISAAYKQAKKELGV